MSNNPMLSNKALERSIGAVGEGQMTIQGTLNKTLALLACVLLPAMFVWQKAFAPIAQGAEQATAMFGLGSVSGLIGIGVVAGFVLSLVTIFKQSWAPVTAPLYALCEGLAIGGISAFFEIRYPGIVLNAVGLTFCTLFCMLVGYKAGIIRVTEKFRMVMAVGLMSIMAIYIVDLIAGFFFHAPIPFVHQGGVFGIIFSLIVIVFAALSFALDFDFIERGAEAGAAKYMEWYGAFGVMVTLIWLYLEFLRLLSKLRDR